MKTRTIVSIILATATVVLGTIFFVTKLRKKHRDGVAVISLAQMIALAVKTAIVMAQTNRCVKHLAVMQMPAPMKKKILIPVHPWQQIK